MRCHAAVHVGGDGNAARAAQAARGLAQPGQIVASQALEPQFDPSAAALAEIGPENQVIDAYRRGVSVTELFACRSNRLPFQASAADGAEGAVEADQHAGTGLARR